MKNFDDNLDELLQAHFDYKLTDIKWDHCRPGEIPELEKKYQELRHNFEQNHNRLNTGE